jgi:hypothetical protein
MNDSMLDLSSGQGTCQHCHFYKLRPGAYNRQDSH